MPDCIFCKIIKGEIPNYTVYEDDQVLAFLDINPHAKGHTVVIPKVHVETLLALDEELLKPLLLGVKRAMEKIEATLHPAGYNIGVNHGKIAGQAVPHLHFHILPRYQGDGGGNIHSIINNQGGVTVDEIAKLF